MEDLGFASRVYGFSRTAMEHVHRHRTFNLTRPFSCSVSWLYVDVPRTQHLAQYALLASTSIRPSISAFPLRIVH